MLKWKTKKGALCVSTSESITSVCVCACMCVNPFFFKTACVQQVTETIRNGQGVKTQKKELFSSLLRASSHFSFAILMKIKLYQGTWDHNACRNGKERRLPG